MNKTVVLPVAMSFDILSPLSWNLSMNEPLCLLNHIEHKVPMNREGVVKYKQFIYARTPSVPS